MRGCEYPLRVRRRLVMLFLFALLAMAAHFVAAMEMSDEDDGPTTEPHHKLVKNEGGSTEVPQTDPKTKKRALDSIKSESKKTKVTKIEEVSAIDGYVYMNVLGPYYDDTTKISDGYVVLKVGKASTTTLNTRMQDEFNAAAALKLNADWPRHGTRDPTGAKAFQVYLKSFEPTAEDALPYIQIPKGSDLDEAEKTIRGHWGEVLGADRSLAWFAKRSGRSTDACKGDVRTLGATSETVVVLWSDVTRVRQAGRDAGPTKWTSDAVKDAIAAAKGEPALEEMKAEWTKTNDAQLNLLPLVEEQGAAYRNGIVGFNNLSPDQAKQISDLIAKQTIDFLALLESLQAEKGKNASDP